MTKQQNTPTCFVSYSWDSDNYKQWVLNLASLLTSNGVDVHLDEWEVLLGNNLTQFMESGIRESDYVLIVCTPNYANKANERKSGVGYETSVITGELFQLCPNRNKYVPILREGTPETSVPSYLKGSLFADFRKDSEFKSKFEVILRHIFHKPRYPRPAKGQPPLFKQDSEINVNTAQQLPQVSDVPNNFDTLIVKLQKQLKDLHESRWPTYINGGQFVNLGIDKSIGELIVQLTDLQGQRKYIHDAQMSQNPSEKCIDMNPLSRMRTEEIKAQEQEDTRCYRCGMYTMYGARCVACGAFRDN